MLLYHKYNSPDPKDQTMVKLNVPKKANSAAKKSSPAKNDRLTLRLSAKERFAIELLALKEGVTVSRLLMRIAEPALKLGLTKEKVKGNHREKIYIPDEAFDPLDPDRLVKLALIEPNLLTDMNAVIWKVIQEEPKYWTDDEPYLKEIRNNWSAIEDKANELIKKFSD